MEIEKNFNKLHSFIDKLNESFDKNVLSKKQELDWLKNEISNKIESSKDILNKTSSLNSSIVTLESKVSEIEDKITEKKSVLSKLKVKDDELNQLKSNKDKLLVDIKDINLELTSIMSKFVMETENFQQLQNNIAKLTISKDNLVSEVTELKEENKLVNLSIGDSEDKLEAIKNNVISKEVDFELIYDKINKGHKEFNILTSRIEELESNKNSLDVKLVESEKMLNSALKKSQMIIENADVEKNKLKHEEDRLLSLRKEIETTILNNREQVDANKLAEFIKSIDDGRNKRSK